MWNHHQYQVLNLKWMFLIYLDVNESLSRLISIIISSLNDLSKLDSSIINLIISHGSCNNESNLRIDL